MCRAQADGGRRCPHTRAVTAGRKRLVDRWRRAQARGSSTAGEALDAIIRADHDLATLLAGARDSELAAAVLSAHIVVGRPDPEVLEAAAANRWGALPAGLRVAAGRLAAERRQMARRDAQEAARELTAAWQQADSPQAQQEAAQAVLRAAPEVLVAVTSAAVTAGDSRLAAVALTATAMPADVRAKTLTALARGRTATGTQRQAMWRECAVPVLRHCAARGLGWGAGREAERLAGMLPDDKGRATALAAVRRAGQERAVDRERLAGALDRVTGEGQWVPVAGSRAAVAAAGGPAAVSARWRAAWAQAQQVHATAAEHMRAWHIDHWGVWGGQRRFETAAARDAVELI